MFWTFVGLILVCLSAGVTVLFMGLLPPKEER